MKDFGKILKSKKAILLTLYAVAVIICGQLLIIFLYKDLETKRNHFVETRIDNDTIVDVYQTRYTPGKGYYTEIKTNTNLILPILVEDDSNVEHISTNAIINKNNDSPNFKVSKDNTGYDFKLKSLAKEKSVLRIWVLFCSGIAAFGIFRKVFETVQEKSNKTSS